MEFLQVDVFADAPYQGNPLAVFPDAVHLQGAEMQLIAREMNLSETAFVTSSELDSYSVRIFTPAEELPFAGHPTLGTAWVLRRLGRLRSEEVTQRSGSGTTPVRLSGDRATFTRAGRAAKDLDDTRQGFAAELERALGLRAGDVGLEARELGRAGRLRPAWSDAGLNQMMVPVRALGPLERCRPNARLLEELELEGAYCFTAVQAGRLRARGFWPGFGVFEDPATGSAAAALGVYLADRLGNIDAEVVQGVEMGRPSRIFLRSRAGQVEVGGDCRLVLTGRLEHSP
jgi:trans-2,3-dihydro-3-hydroxyanthranilate isomerase